MAASPTGIGWLMDPSPFVCRWCCGAFDGGLGQAWIVISLAIAGSYFVIAAILTRMYFSSGRVAGEDTFPRWALAPSAMFFLGCGGGHLWNAVAFWWPAYRLFVLWDLYTMTVSVVGAYAAYRVYRWVAGRLDELKDRQATADELKDRQAVALEMLEENCREAARRVQTPSPAHQRWVDAQVVALNDVMRVLKGGGP